MQAAFLPREPVWLALGSMCRRYQIAGLVLPLCHTQRAFEAAGRRRVERGRTFLQQERLTNSLPTKGCAGRAGQNLITGVSEEELSPVSKSHPRALIESCENVEETGLYRCSSARKSMVAIAKKLDLQNAALRRSRAVASRSGVSDLWSTKSAPRTPGRAQGESA